MSPNEKHKTQVQMYLCLLLLWCKMNSNLAKTALIKARIVLIYDIFQCTLTLASCWNIEQDK